MTLEEANEKYLNKDIIILKAAGLKFQTANELIGECFKIIDIQVYEGYQLCEENNLKLKFYLNVQPLCYHIENYFELDNDAQYWLWIYEFALIPEIEQQRLENLKQISI